MASSLTLTLAPWPAVQGQLSSFVTILRRGTIHDSRTLTGLAAGLLANLVGGPEAAKLSVSAVSSAVTSIAEHFAAVAPTEFAVGSVARRVAAIIREELAKVAAPAASVTPTAGAAGSPTVEAAGGGGISAARARAVRALAADAAPSVAAVAAVVGTSDSGVAFSVVQEGVVSGVAELKDEIDALGSSLEAQALELFSPGDVALTHGNSRAAVGLLAYAARKARVESFVTEGGPSLSGHAAALALATPAASSKVALRTLIPDAGVWAVMPRVTKVVLGARAVTPAGDVVADAGALLVAQAATAHGVPVVVVCSVLELVPAAVVAAAPWRDAQGSAAEVLPPGLAAAAGGAEVVVPLLDLIPAALVALVVTNAQAVAPGQVARLFDETY